MRTMTRLTSLMLPILTVGTIGVASAASQGDTWSSGARRCGGIELSDTESVTWFGNQNSSTEIRSRVEWSRRQQDGTWKVVRESTFTQLAEGVDPCLDATSRAFDDAQFLKSKAALAKLMTTDAIYVTSKGQVLDAQAFIDDIADPATEYEPFVIRDRRILPAGADGALVVAEGRVAGTIASKPFAGRFRYVDAFKVVDGQWRVHYVQVSPLSNP